MPTLLTAEKRKTLEAAPQNRPTRARRIIAFTADRFLVSACVWHICVIYFLPSFRPAIQFVFSWLHS
jgi:hypothetical protein